MASFEMLHRSVDGPPAHHSPHWRAGVARIAFAVVFAPQVWAQPVGSFAVAVARPGCTQKDFPAVEIMLSAQAWVGISRPPPPFLRIEVAGVDAGTHIKLDLSPLARDPTVRNLARAEWYDGGSPGPVWLTGTLDYEQDAQSMSVQGSYRVCVSSGQCFDGSFTAPWRARVAQCG